MYFLFSGEGASDCGTVTGGTGIRESDHFHYGPMVHMVSQLVEPDSDTSPSPRHKWGLVPRSNLKLKLTERSSKPKSLSLSGLKRPKETLNFYRSALALARWAQDWDGAKPDEVVAILFHDSDDKQSTPARAWQEKHDAVLEGFRAGGFDRGVPMLPRPTSEAWFICALKSDAYQNCDSLEERSGSPKAQKPLKKELKEIIGQEPTGEAVSELIQSGKIQGDRINMRSFNVFRERLRSVMGSSHS